MLKSSFFRSVLSRSFSSSLRINKEIPKSYLSTNVATYRTSQNQSSHQKKIPKKRIFMGTSDFDEVIDKNALTVDKTLFIKEFMEDLSKVSVILRPRRFGKSWNLSMLMSFLSLGADRKKFDRFLIGKETEIVEEHCGKYPVVFLDLKDCKGKNWEEMYYNIWSSIRIMMKRHYTLENVPEELDFSSLDPPIRQHRAKETLFWLTYYLEKQHGQKVIVLVDEYDAPLNHAFRKGFYEEASEFFGSFYSKALKGNMALQKACLMGIVEIRGSGILSGLNNIRVCSVANKQYESCFGFCAEEVNDMLKTVGESNKFDQVIDWYNGYHIGDQTVINPWSFIRWLSELDFDSYWVQTSNTENISTMLRPYFKSDLINIVTRLVGNQKLDVSRLSTDVYYKADNWDIDSIIHFLVLTGYLTYSKQEGSDRGLVWIPNHEVRTQWKTDIVTLLNEKYSPVFQKTINDIFVSQEFDPIGLQEVMQQMLLYPSSHDVSSRYECSYHMFYFGMFLALFQGGNIQVSSNRESGHGRYDIKILFPNMEKCFIFEFKLSKRESDLDKDAQTGLEQIISNNYGVEILNEGYECIGIGIAFYKKQLSAIKWQLLTKQS